MNYIKLAEKHGAKFREGDGIYMLWIVLDQEDNFLYDAFFNTQVAAAKAYCLVHNLKG